MKTLALAIIVACILAAVPVQADTLSIRADIWCPYNCAPTDPHGPGFMIEAARIIFAQAGHKIDYQLLNWARSIKMVREGRYHAVVGAGQGDAPDFIFPELALGYSRNGFFTRKGHPWRFQGIDSLKSVTVGIINDYSYGPDFNAYLHLAAKTDRVQQVSGDNALELNIRKLLAGRIDVIIENQYVFLHRIRALGLSDKVRFAGHDGSRGPVNHVYIAFSPALEKSREYARILSRGIRRLRQSGQLDRILAKYGLTDWQNDPDK